MRYIIFQQREGKREREKEKCQGGETFLTSNSNSSLSWLLCTEKDLEMEKYDLLLAFQGLLVKQTLIFESTKKSRHCWCFALKIRLTVCEINFLSLCFCFVFVICLLLSLCPVILNNKVVRISHAIFENNIFGHEYKPAMSALIWRVKIFMSPKSHHHFCIIPSIKKLFHLFVLTFNHEMNNLI